LAGGVGCLDVIAHAEIVEEDDHHAGGEIAEGILQCQADGQRAGAQHGDDGLTGRPAMLAAITSKSTNSNQYRRLVRKAESVWSTRRPASECRRKLVRRHTIQRPTAKTASATTTLGKYSMRTL